MILDGHVHVGRWTDAWYPGLGVDWLELDQELHAAGVEGALVTTSDERNQEELISPPEGLRGRYWLLPWVDPNDSQDLALLDSLGERIAGMKVHPSANKVPIDDPRWDPFLSRARERGWVVLVHCGRWQEMSGYARALNAAVRHPEVRFILAHMGGDTPELALSAQAAIAEGGMTNVWLGLEGMREYWIVARGIERLGIQRFIFGSDFPIGHPRMYLGLIEALSLDDREKDLLRGGNLRSLLGMTE